MRCGVHVVVAERLNDELADNGRVLFKESVTKPVCGTGHQVRDEVAEEEGREDEPGRGAGGEGDNDADEEDHEERARYGDPGDLKDGERGRLTGALSRLSSPIRWARHLAHAGWGSGPLGRRSVG